MDEKYFVPDTDEHVSYVHLRDPRGIDYTLCGVSMDGVPDPWEESQGMPTPAPNKKITCPGCIEIIKVCKKVRL